MGRKQKAKDARENSFPFFGILHLSFTFCFPFFLWVLGFSPFLFSNDFPILDPRLIAFGWFLIASESPGGHRLSHPELPTESRYRKGKKIPKQQTLNLGRNVLCL